MRSTNVVMGPPLGVAAVPAVVLAAAVGHRCGPGTARQSLVAGARAVVQLGAVSLLRGAIPVEAGAVQVLVLLLLLGVQSVAVAVVLEPTCRGRIRPATAAA